MLYFSAKVKNYAKAVLNTKVVGEQVSDFIKKLNDHFGIKMSARSHIIGHSLGAHVAGYAGADVKRLGMGNLPRITG